MWRMWRENRSRTTPSGVVVSPVDPTTSTERSLKTWYALSVLLWRDRHPDTTGNKLLTFERGKSRQRSQPPDRPLRACPRSGTTAEFRGCHGWPVLVVELPVLPPLSDRPLSRRLARRCGASRWMTRELARWRHGAAVAGGKRSSAGCETAGCRVAARLSGSTPGAVPLAERRRDAERSPSRAARRVP